MRRPILIAGTAAGLATLAVLARRPVADMTASLRRCSAPSVRAYDLLAGPLLRGFYAHVAADAARAVAERRAPDVLEIGSGPGHLAVRLARSIPGLRYTGLDLDPAMVEVAADRAGREGLALRLRFLEGDVAALPFEDAAFDLVVSTLSVHHWIDPLAGFRELRRVLRPEGSLVVYDVAPGWARLESRGPGLAAAAAEAFGVRTEGRRVAWPGPLRLTVRLELGGAA